MNERRNTGMKDKNGIDIVEGDIFKDDDCLIGRAVVEFHQGMFGWWSDGGEKFIPLSDCKNIEVIGRSGNIWQAETKLDQFLKDKKPITEIDKAKVAVRICFAVAFTSLVSLIIVLFLI